jgi:hypothetical protein
MTARLAALGSSAFLISPGDFGKFISDEPEKWEKAIKFANIKPDWAGRCSKIPAARAANGKRH